MVLVTRIIPWLCIAATGLASMEGPLFRCRAARALIVLARVA